MKTNHFLHEVAMRTHKYIVTNTGKKAFECVYTTMNEFVS